MSRRLAALLALLVVVAGCSSGTSSSTSAPPTQAETTAASAATTPAPSTTTAPTQAAPANPLATSAQLALTNPTGYSMTLDFTWAGAVATDVGSNPPGKVDLKVSETSFGGTLTNTTVGGRTMPLGQLDSFVLIGGLFAVSGPACTGLKDYQVFRLVYAKKYCFIKYDTILSPPAGGALSTLTIPNNTPLSYTSADLSTTVGFGTGTTFAAASEAAAPAIVKDLNKPLAVVVWTNPWKPAGAACTQTSGSDVNYFALLNGATAASVPGCAG